MEMDETAVAALCEGATEAERSDRTELKCAQVMDGARAVFIASGFEGASVDEIARTAGISKATLYRHYSDKTALFNAVMERELAGQTAQFPDITLTGRTLKAFLVDVARSVVTFSLSPFGQAIYRIAVAESGRFPHIGHNFYACGPERNRSRLAPVLAEASERGVLMPLDADHAAHVFFAICKADVFPKRLFQVDGGLSAPAIDAHSRRSVETFLRAYHYDEAASSRPPEQEGRLMTDCR